MEKIIAVVIEWLEAVAIVLIERLALERVLDELEARALDLMADMWRRQRPTSYGVN